jgi:hypothetical protein
MNLEKTMNTKLLITLLLAISLLAACAEMTPHPMDMSKATAGPNYYVATTGSDSYTSTQAKNPATPWKTIQKAANNVSAAGSTVHVAPGTYTMSTSTLTSIDYSGTASARITYISDVKWGAKIVGTSSDGLIRINGNYIDFKDFEMYGTGPVEEGLYIYGSHNRVIGNKIHDLTSNGIVEWHTNEDSTGNEYYSNLIYNVGSNTLDHGIYVMGRDGIVSNNIIYNSSGYGIHAWHAAYAYTFSNNLVWNCRKSGILVGNGDDPGGTIADNYIVTNNISIYNDEYAILEFGDTGTNNIYENNLSYGNKLGSVRLQNGNADQNTITADPKLVNFKLDGTGDYHLSATSPAIDAGTSQGIPTTDFDRLLRTGITDIGPFNW